MTILVTGGAGYIGSHVVDVLCRGGKSVVVYDDLRNGDRAALLHAVPLYVADLSDLSTLRQVFKEHSIETVMHFAGSISVPESVQDPLSYYTNNTANTSWLFKLCVEHGVSQIIFSSTAAVYGNPSTDYVSETSPVQPTNPYGHSKYLSECMLLEAVQRYHLRAVILRYFNVAGADPEARLGQRGRYATHIIKVACQVMAGLQPGFTLFGDDYSTLDGTCIRDYLHVVDLAEAHVAAMQYLQQGGETQIFNVGYGRGYSVREVLAHCQAISPIDFPIKVGPRRLGDPAMLVAQAEKIRAVLDWQPRYNDLSLIIKDAWRWEQRLYLSSPGMLQESIDVASTP